VIPEATVSGTHATLRWQNGSWVIEDLGSTNGSYADHSYERKERRSRSCTAARPRSASAASSS
jgi:pSer/pThr/pTyr-binding forkhead associated (FHA) protein